LKEPLSQQEKAGILEVNASPGLRMHHYPYQGEPRNVAGALLDFVIESKDVGI
jgi:cyanophycin synthetase